MYIAGGAVVVVNAVDAAHKRFDSCKTLISLKNNWMETETILQTSTQDLNLFSGVVGDGCTYIGSVNAFCAFASSIQPIRKMNIYVESTMNEIWLLK